MVCHQGCVQVGDDGCGLGPVGDPRVGPGHRDSALDRGELGQNREDARVVGQGAGQYLVRVQTDSDDVIRGQAITEDMIQAPQPSAVDLALPDRGQLPVDLFRLGLEIPALRTRGCRR